MLILVGEIRLHPYYQRAIYKKVWIFELF